MVLSVRVRQLPGVQRVGVVRQSSTLLVFEAFGLNSVAKPVVLDYGLTELNGNL